jgi:hypothetical protein
MRKVHIPPLSKRPRHRYLRSLYGMLTAFLRRRLGETCRPPLMRRPWNTGGPGKGLYTSLLESGF